MNSDRWPDLVWRHAGDGGLASWLMSDSTVLSTQWLYPPANTDLTWRIVGVADIAENGVHDGKPDLIWQNTTTGYLGLWYMNGLETRQTIYLTPNTIGPSSNWRIVGMK